MKDGAYPVMDSSRLKIYAEGEWIVRKHGYSKRRTWRKLHTGIDANSGEIVYTELTTNSGDSKEAEKAIKDRLLK